MFHRRIIGVDPGNRSCGMVVLDNGQIKAAFNLDNDLFWRKITGFLIHPNCTVVLEDIRPYSLKLSLQVIDTCKFIGEAVYRLKNDCGANVELVSRNEVKKWAFDTFPGICRPLIERRISKKTFLACDIRNRELIEVSASGGPRRKPSFVYVDDRIMTECMKFLYQIPMPPPGSGYQFGLKDHAWQALSVAAWLNHSKYLSVK